MHKKIKQKLVTLILIASFIGRLSLPLAVFAQSAPPPPPGAPSQPNEAPPPPNSAPQQPNTAPTAGPAPQQPNTAPTAGPQPTQPNTAPTAGPQPTQPNTAPTSSALPTGTQEPTGTASSPYPTGTDPYDSYTAGPSGATGVTGSTDFESSATGASGDSGAYGSTGSGGNINDPYNLLTGPGSYNYGQEIIDQSLAKVNQNLAEMQNKIDAMTSSGFNYANYNTLSGEVLTGQVINQVNLLNKLNSNMSGLGAFSTLDIYGNYYGDIQLQFVDGSPLSAFANASETVAKNSVTGPLSQNYSVSDGNFQVKEANGNDATINNDINLVADTGNNQASANTGNGLVATGDATALANIINMVNTNINAAKWLFAVINIYGEMLGDILLPKSDTNSGTATNGGGDINVGNSNTGPDSVNYSDYTSNTTAEFTNTNNADIVSNLNVGATTGNNTSSFNTGGGYVSSGMADSSVANSTVANSNTVDEEGTVWLVIVNEMGKWVGHIVGSDPTSNSASNSLPVTTQTSGAGEESFAVYSQNDATGPLSTNVNQISQSESTEITNTNNAAINNNINASANTGNNEAKYNTGVGAIETGDASSAVSLLNLANVNVTAKKFVVLFVNVLGNFVGDVVPDGQVNQTNGDNYSQGGDPLPTLIPTISPLPTLPPADDVIVPPVGGLEELPTYEDPQAGQEVLGDDSGNVTYVYYYYPEEYENPEYYYYQDLYQGTARRITAKKNMTNKNNLKAGTVTQIGQVKRGTSFSTSFVKAVEGSAPGTLIGGISLKVTNSWLLFIPLAVFIYVYRRKNRINIDINRYINMLLDIVL